MQGLERLHYFNGQRLVARDLELEQSYHMRVRRLLNRGLYTPGVVSGLELEEVDGRHVRVKAGVALDPGGREVILVGDATLAVPNRQPGSALPGYFLVIRYDEETEPGEMADCKEGSGTTPPSRILEAPILSWSETWPNQSDCGTKGHAADCVVVLGLVALNDCCQIARLDTSVRQWSRSAVPRQVYAFALEGEKDIDSANPKRLHFQIHGGEPESVWLYLWVDAISSLYYTELGSHDHALTAAGTSSVPFFDHRHSLAGIRTLPPEPFPTHHHALFVGPEVDPLKLTGSFLTRAPVAPVAGWVDGYMAEDGFHTHSLNSPVTGLSTGNLSGSSTLSLTGRTDLAGQTVPAAGTQYRARTGPAYGYPKEMRVKLDTVDITARITGKLGWPDLGNGKSDHPLVTTGTGGIDLVELGVGLAVGGHTLEFLVASGGGKVLYNLYVE
jgi:hypothetical protein